MHGTGTIACMRSMLSLDVCMDPAVRGGLGRHAPDRCATAKSQKRLRTGDSLPVTSIRVFHMIKAEVTTSPGRQRQGTAAHCNEQRRAAQASVLRFPRAGSTRIKTHWDHLCFLRTKAHLD